MSKAPAFQFYPGDWQRDAALQSCSIAARGLWMEMLCIMHQSQPYGCLKINGKVVEISTLSRLVGASQREVKTLIEELENAGVFQRDSDGAICSKRMINDEKTRKARAEGGKKGGNPRLTLKDNQEVEGKVNLQANLPPTPSSSSSSSISPTPLNSTLTPTVKRVSGGGCLDQLKFPECLQSPLGQKAVRDYVELLVSLGKFNPFSFQGNLDDMAHFSKAKAVGYFRAWHRRGKYVMDRGIDWEEYAPTSAELEAESTPKQQRVRLPRVQVSQ